MKLTRWVIDYLDGADLVVGRHPEFCFSAEQAEVVASNHVEEYEGAITWRVREVRLQV
jgi:hypothetical protein